MKSTGAQSPLEGSLRAMVAPPPAGNPVPWEGKVAEPLAEPEETLTKGKSARGDLVPAKPRGLRSCVLGSGGFGSLGNRLSGPRVSPASPVSGGAGLPSPQQRWSPALVCRKPSLGRFCPRGPRDCSYWGPRGILAQPPVRGAGSLSISVHTRAFPGSAHPTSVGQSLLISGQFLPPQSPSPHEVGEAP